MAEMVRTRIRDMSPVETQSSGSGAAVTHSRPTKIVRRPNGSSAYTSMSASRAYSRKSPG